MSFRLRLVLAITGLIALSGIARSQAPSVVVFVGPHGGIMDAFIPAGKALGLTIRASDDGAIVRDPKSIADAEVVLLQHMRGESKESFANALATAKKLRPSMKFIALTAQGTALGKFEALAGGVIEDPKINAYYEGATNENLKRLAGYLAKTYFAFDAKIEAPEARKSIGLWHPDHEGTFADTAAWIAWEKARTPDFEVVPVRP